MASAHAVRASMLAQAIVGARTMPRTSGALPAGMIAARRGSWAVPDFGAGPTAPPPRLSGMRVTSRASRKNF